MGNKSSGGVVLLLQDAEHQEDRLTALFKSLDKDGDGILSKEELFALANKIVKQKRKLGIDITENHPVAFSTALFNAMTNTGERDLTWEVFRKFWVKLKREPPDYDVSHQVSVCAPIDKIKEAMSLTDKSINEPDVRGQTPLFHAVKNNYFDAVKLLLENGADINHKDDMDGQTPIFFAKGVEMVKFLVENGAKVDIKTLKNKNTILHHLVAQAKSVSDLDIALLNNLIELGADPTMQNLDGLTAAEFASSRGFEVDGVLWK